jgi:hypothetical protein
MRGSRVPENLHGSYPVSSKFTPKRGGEAAAKKTQILDASASCRKAYDPEPAIVKEHQLRAFRDWYGRWAYSLTAAE